MNNIFSETINKLKSLKVTIAGTELEPSTVKSLEFAYCNTRPIVRGQLYFNDLYDMNMLTDWSIAKVQVTFVDLLDDMFSRTFHVVNVEEANEEMGRKSFILDLVDEFSYALSQSYISRSFKIPLNEAVLEIASDLGVSEIPHIELDFSEVPYDKPYLTSKNINSLTYFTRELYRKGYTFYQTKTGILIKSLDDLIPVTCPLNGEFSDHPKNEYYMNKVIEFNVLQNNRQLVDSKSTTLTYDPLTKTTKKLTEDPLNSLRLNSGSVNLSDSVTEMEYFQSQLDPSQRSLDLKREYMDQNVVQMYVTGFVKNDLNQIYDMRFKGNDTYMESQMKGDELLSGRYISKMIQEKIILDSYVQMITIHRADQMETADVSGETTETEEDF